MSLMAERRDVYSTEVIEVSMMGCIIASERRSKVGNSWVLVSGE